MPRRKTGSKRGNGEGTVFQRKDGRWVTKLTLPDGRRKEFYGSTREQAVSKMDAAKAALRAGQTLPSERVTVASYTKTWLTMKHSTVRYKTYSNWESMLRLHVVAPLGRVQLSKLTQAHLQNLYSLLLHNGLSPSTVNTVHRTVKNMLRTAERTDLIPRCVADLVQPPSVKRRDMLILSEVQAKALLLAVGSHRLGALFELALMSGARISELLALRWQDVSFEKQEIHIRQALQRTEVGIKAGEPKTKSGRRAIPLDEGMMESLRRHRAFMAEEALKLGSVWNNVGDLVFVSTSGTQLNYSNLRQRLFLPFVTKAALPSELRLHDLRHFFASYALGRGVPVTTVSVVMGHSSPAVTHAIYAHCIPGNERRIADTMSRLRAG